MHNWMRGITEPTKRKQAEIIEKLKLNPDAFAEPRTDGIPTYTVEQVSKLMHLGANTVRKGLQQGVFPWGYAIKSDTSWSYFINARRFIEIERMTEK